jgi:hypothetical protein
MEYKKDEDGNDLLDEQGNPIPLENTDEKELEAAKEREAKLAEEKKNLVEELKEIRLKLGVTEGLLKDKKEVDPNKPLSDDEKLELLLEKKLKEKDALNAQANKKAAFEKFVTENSEFNPANDPTGLKRDALEKKVNQFNTEGLTSVEQFTSVIRDAKTLLVGNDNQPETSGESNPPSNPPKGQGNTGGKRVEELTPKELKLAQTTGKTKEQILKLKQKNPDYLEQLLEFVRD